MATRREADVVYAAGLVQGTVLVTFPAASMIFTDPGEYDLSSTQFFTSDQPVAYGLLLGATACLGVGFGLTVPAINSLTAVFHPAAVDRSALVLNALLGWGRRWPRCSWRSSTVSASGGVPLLSGCSVLLPLTISFGPEQLVAMSASVTGGVIAFYQLGYGIAASGARSPPERRRRPCGHLRVYRGGGGGPGGPVVRADRSRNGAIPYRGVKARASE
jgi:hypothetical protein